jgi:hypothetical protein
MQSPSYTPASVPPKYAEEFCKAFDKLASLSVLYEAQFIVAVDADEDGTFRFGLEREDPKGMALIPLIEGTSDKAILLESRTKLRELLGGAKRFDDWQWRYIKAAVRSVPELTRRIRLCVARIETTADGGSHAYVGVENEGKNSYLVGVENGIATQVLGSCFAVAPFGKPRLGGR